MDPAKLAAAAETAHEEIIYLAGVVNDLSTLSRAERGVADQAEPVDMDQLFHDLYTRFEPGATKKSLKLNLDIKGKLPIIEVSRLYMEEMIQNLTTNAIKYTKTGSVTLAAEVVKGGIKCSVIDTGIGISKSDQTHLGERFFRSEDYRTRETNGTGLGLYVVDKLAMKIGTRIKVESRLNHGSTFSLVVPLRSGTHATGKRSTLPLPES
jgi:signal transduction histidine kinase